MRCCVVEPVFTGGFTITRFVGEDPEKIWHKAWRQCPDNAELAYEEQVIIYGNPNLLVFHVCLKHKR